MLPIRQDDTGRGRLVQDDTESRLVQDDTGRGRLVQDDTGRGHLGQYDLPGLVAISSEALVERFVCERLVRHVVSSALDTWFLLP